ncbi:MAG: pyrimidine/purine nucleoside phosphorylase [Sulfuriferula sp.]
MAQQFDQVSIIKQANIYFDGRCVSHTVLFADGSKKTLGVIFPSRLIFNTALPEIMEINAGTCKVRLADTADWKTYQAGERFSVPGNSHFEIETLTMLDYVCHFGTEAATN